jgi:hypothetical protein
VVVESELVIQDLGPVTFFGGKDGYLLVKSQIFKDKKSPHKFL